MLKRLFTAVILAGLFYQPVLNGAAGLTADVDKLVAQVDLTSRVPVIVKFNKSINIYGLRRSISKKHQYEPAIIKSQSRQKKQLRRRLLTGLQDQLIKPKAKLAKILRDHGVKTRLKSLWVINAVALDLPANLVDEIAAMPEVERITVDMQLTMSDDRVEGLTTDPLWNLININTEQLWQQGIDGDGVTVAIMDSGVELNHPDLIEKWRGGTNSWFDPYQQNELPADMVGHGTQALGIILGGDESGYQIGMAPEAKWIAAKIFDNANESTLSAIHESFQWLLDPDGDPLTDDAPDLVNNSWGFSTTINECFQEFSEDIKLLREAGIGVVFSAGNFGPSTESSISPANDPGALSVGSVDQSNEIELLSSRGPGACDGGVFPKLAAPGSLIFTADLLPNAYNIVSGTSFAAPHVTGAMALLKSAFPDATLSQIETALYDSALDLGEAGTDDSFGYGLLDVAAAHALLESNFGSNENSRIEFNESLFSVDENTQKLIVTVRRSGGSKGEASVDYTTIEDEAKQGRDYAISKGTLQFNDGETLRSFEVFIHDDDLDEENESFYVALSNVDGNATLGEDLEAEVIILDNDGTGAISFGAVAYAVNESKQQAIIDLIRTGGSTGIVDVEYQLLAKSAAADIDFVADNGTIRFQPGETQKEIHVELVDDTLHEDNETFQIILTAVSEDASIAEPASTTVTILDNDPDIETVTIYLDAVSYDVNESSNQVFLTVIRSGDLEASASVKYKTIDGSAIKESDYVDTSGTLTFPAGVTRRTIAIEIINDGLYEEESSFTLILTDASGNATITTPSAAIVRIIDDDALPFVSIHSSPGHSNGGLPSRFSSNREALEQDSIQNQTRSRSDRGSSLKIFDLSLRGYDSSALLDRLGLQAPEASVTTQSRDGDAEKHAEDNKKSECGSTAISADPGACSSDNEKETAAPADSKDVQTVAEFPEVDADSTTGDAAPQATSDAPLGNSSESSPPQ
ncbi:MAG: S8 family serine peptidase [Candidatus Thiodiazotropha sp. (ex Clathrolucina costata)]|nr:S8 family serine peptidase [Candidatus Thiodiazotropha taylori]MCG7863874.1 S8 family serine peptidase [Candidatus Thiodiazotropha endolucinida]